MEWLLRKTFKVAGWYIRKYGDDYARKELRRLEFKMEMFLMEYNEPEVDWK